VEAAQRVAVYVSCGAHMTSNEEVYRAALQRAYDELRRGATTWAWYAICGALGIDAVKPVGWTEKSWCSPDNATECPGHFMSGGGTLKKDCPSCAPDETTAVKPVTFSDKSGKAVLTARIHQGDDLIVNARELLDYIASLASENGDGKHA